MVWLLFIILGGPVFGGGWLIYTFLFSPAYRWLAILYVAMVIYQKDISYTGGLKNLWISLSFRADTSSHNLSSQQQSERLTETFSIFVPVTTSGMIPGTASPPNSNPFQCGGAMALWPPALTSSTVCCATRGPNGGKP